VSGEELVRLPEGKEPALRVIPMPADANHTGDIFGGWIMAQVIKAGRTSITVDVQVYAQRRPEREECVKVTEAILTYVAVDSERRPRPVPGRG